MADRYTQVVILCEDFTHFNFVRQYLMRRGIESRRIRPAISPAGRGAGTQYVIRNYPVEVQAIRSKSYLRAGLVAVIDADKSSVDDRLRELEQSLVRDSKPSRGDDERIGLLVPKRNIETWVFYLLGYETNEDDDYKKQIPSSAIRPSVAAFSEMCPSKGGTISLPSLRRACKELTAFVERGG